MDYENAIRTALRDFIRDSVESHGWTAAAARANKNSMEYDAERVIGEVFDDVLEDVLRECFK